MAKITNVKAREILNSRGEPTVEVEVFTETSKAVASCPSGKSKGKHEAIEVRDNNPKRYRGKGVLKAVNIINNYLKNHLIGKDSSEFKSIDEMLIKLDGTKNKSNLGVNSILPISIAVLKVYSLDNNKLFFEGVVDYFNLLDYKVKKLFLPTPMANLINGGKHAGNNLSFQEFMVVPIKIKETLEKIRAIVEIFYTLKEILLKKYGKSSINVGDEGGFAPPLNKNEEAIELLVESIEESGYSKEVFVSLDCAASSFYKDGFYYVDDKKLERLEYLSYLIDLIDRYKDVLYSVEDPFYEEDFDMFSVLNIKYGKKIKIVGDDLYTTNLNRLKIGVKKKSTNSILIKPNQIGTILETLEVIKYAKENNITPIVSHRSGETNDNFIVHIAIGTNSPLVKIGAPNRGERIAKYNELIRLSEVIEK